MRENPRKKLKNRCVALICAITTMVLFLCNEGAMVVNAETAPTLPLLVLTELYPDDIDRSSAAFGPTNPAVNLCEYVEIYNNTNNPIDFNDQYQITYTNQSPTTLAVSSIGSTDPVIIPAKGCAVFWLTRPDLAVPKDIKANITEQNFRDIMKVPQSVPVYSMTGQKGIYEYNRAFSLVEKSLKKVISTYWYTAGDVADGMSVELRVTANETMEAFNKRAIPNPGVVKPEQLTFAPKLSWQNETDHFEANTDHELVMTSDQELSDAKVSYWSTLDTDPATRETHTADMTYDGEDGNIYSYRADVNIVEMGTYYLQFAATDKAGKVTSLKQGEEGFLIQVLPPDSAEPTLPALILTELYPDDIDRSVKFGLSNPAVNLCEYVEIYNNTEIPIDFNTLYQITYTYQTPKTLVVSSIDSTDPVIIPAKGCAVFWATRPDLVANNTIKTNITEQDFRTIMSIPESVPVYSMTGQNGIYESNRAFSLVEKSSKKVISTYWYTAEDVTDGKSVELRVTSDENMEALYTRALPNPGAVKPEQLRIAPILSWQNETELFEVSKDNKLVMTSDKELSKATVSYWSTLDTEPATRKTHTVDMTYDGEDGSIYTYRADVNIAALGTYYLKFTGTDQAGNVASIKRGAPGYTVRVLPHDDGQAPVLTCTDETLTSVNEGNPLIIPYEYKDSMGVDKISLYYKTTENAEYTRVDTVKFRIAGKYYVEIPGDVLLTHDFVDYYLEAFNPYRSSTTDVKRIKINRADDFTGIRTNLSENEIITGEKLIIAKDKQDKNIKVSVDGKQLDKQSLIEKGAFFTFSYSGNNAYFKNAVSVGKEILTYFAPWSYTMGSKAVFVDGSKYFKYNSDGSAEVTLTLWAGTQGSAFEIKSAPNNDDYTATGIKLVLLDGTVITAVGIDPLTVHKMGDSAGMTEQLDLRFVIPADKVDACGFAWDTTSVEDGLHTITLTSANGTKTIPVLTDNTAPEVSVNLKENDEIRGAFQAQFKITDANKVNDDSLEVYLDGEVLKAPYSFVGSDLSEGAHRIIVKVSDQYGNQAAKEFPFTAKNGYPAIGSSADETLEDGSIKLIAILGENTTDNANVTFYEGTKYDVGDGIRVYSGIGDSAENRKPASLGTVTSPTLQYPYQIFEITTDGADDDTLQIEFDSSASYASPVNAYVFDYTADKWEKLSIKKFGGKNTDDGKSIADSKSTDEDKNTAEFTLSGKVKDRIAKVMIQARASESIPQTIVKQNDTVKNDYKWDGTGIPAQYDFSLAWISDTQYYTESWPENFTIMNHWIVENRDQQDIKYVLHTGDLIDEFEQDYQWVRADENMKLLEDAGLPYGVLAGNHDVAAGNEQYENYWKYFGEDRFKDSPVYGESYKNNLGHYDLVTIDGIEMIILYMSWDIYTDEIKWMNEVLAKYSDRKAMICLHRYITEAGALDYTGELVQNEVVARNPNVFAVLNGHYHGAAINIIAFDDDHDGIKERPVYQILTDYQSAEQGGLSYLKMLYFDLQNNKVYMNAYSPLLDDYNLFDKEKLSSYTDGVISNELDIYELDVDFKQAQRSLTTNSFNANLYTNKEIGETTKLDHKYATTWSGLVKDKKYGWYASAENEYGLQSRSEVNEFQYQGADKPTEPDTPTGHKNNHPGTVPAQAASIEISAVHQTVTATIQSTATVDSNGKANASVTQAQVADAVSKAMEAAAKQGSGATAAVQIKIEAPADVKTVEASLPKAAVDAAAGSNTAGLSVSTPIASIGFDRSALDTIAGEATADVKITASTVLTAELSAETQQMVGSRPVYEFSVTSGGRAISQFGGNVTVSVPYTLRSGEDTNAIVIYHIDEEGKPVVVTNCKYDSVAKSIAFTVTHFSKYAVGYNKVNFKDIHSTDWYSNAVSYVAARSIVSGTGEGNYSPKQKLTRGQFLVMVMRAYGISTDENSKDNFSDAGSTYYTGYLAAAKRIGISQGLGNNLFAPEKEITRNEMVALLYNALKLIDKLPPGNNKQELPTFADANQIAPWAKDAMALFVKAGIVSGNDGKLNPESTTDRAQMAQVLYNLLGK